MLLHHLLLPHHHLLLLHLSLLHHLLLLHQLRLPLRCQIRHLRLLCPWIGCHGLGRSAHSHLIAHHLLPRHHVLLSHLVHLHLHLHLPLSLHHHCLLVRIDHWLDLTHHRHGDTHTIHHELLILHCLHQVHLSCLLHHVVALHVLPDHLLLHELLLHCVLAHHERSAWVVRLHIGHLTHVALLHKVLHCITIVRLLNYFKLVTKNVCLFLAIVALRFKVGDLDVEQPHLA